MECKHHPHPNSEDQQQAETGSFREMNLAHITIGSAQREQAEIEDPVIRDGGIQNVPKPQSNALTVPPYYVDGS